MSVKLLTEHHVQFQSSKGGCTDSSESTLVKMPHCWKSHVTAQMCMSTANWPQGYKTLVQNRTEHHLYYSQVIQT